MIKEINKTFYEVTGTKLLNVSQLKLFTILYDLENNEKFLNIFRSYDISEDLDKNVYYDLYEVENDDWWENISYKFYGTPFLWWMVAIVNSVYNPYEYLEPGLRIKILKSQYVYQILKDIRRIGDL